MTTRPVRIKTYDLPGGDVLANVPFEVKSTGQTFGSGGHYVVRSVHGITDSSGEAVVDLQPTTAMGKDVQYLISFNNQRPFAFRVPVGSGEVALSALLMDAALPPAQYRAALPAGGITGQVLAKQSNVDYDTAWITGGGGGGGLRYEHVQSSAASTWTVNHNFGVFPVVDVLNSAGAKVGAGIQHTSSNQVVISVQPANTGRVICKG